MNNKIMDSKELMKKIMEYGFAITDLGLYLDTHPKDTFLDFLSLKERFYRLSYHLPQQKTMSLTLYKNNQIVSPIMVPVYS